MITDIPRLPDDETALRRAIELDPRSGSAYFNLGSMLAKDAARASEAEAAYRQTIELEPNSARYVYRLGLLLHENLNRPAEAESAYRRAIELAPDEAYYYGGPISLLAHQSRRSEALILGAKMRLLLSASQNWYGLATLDSILGNVNAAIEHLRQAALEGKIDREWARIDPDLASIREAPGFSEIIGGG